MRTDRMSVMSTTNAIASRTIRPAVIRTSSSFGDQRRGAVDLHDVDPLAGFEDVALVVGPGGPHLAPDLDLSLLCVHPLKHRRPLPDECRRAAAKSPGRPHV